MSQKDKWNNLRKKMRRGHHWRASTPKLDIKWGAQKLPDERGYAKQFSSMLWTEISHREILLFFPSPLKSNFIYEWIVSGLFLVTFIVGFAFNLTTGGIGTIEFLLIFIKNRKKNQRKQWFENSFERFYEIGPTLWYSSLLFFWHFLCALWLLFPSQVSLVYSRKRNQSSWFIHAGL